MRTPHRFAQLSALVRAAGRAGVGAVRHCRRSGGKWRPSPTPALPAFTVVRSSERASVGKLRVSWEFKQSNKRHSFGIFLCVELN